MVSLRYTLLEKISGLPAAGAPLGKGLGRAAPRSAAPGILAQGLTAAVSSLSSRLQWLITVYVLSSAVFLVLLEVCGALVFEMCKMILKISFLMSATGEAGIKTTCWQVFYLEYERCQRKDSNINQDSMQGDTCSERRGSGLVVDLDFGGGCFTFCLEILMVLLP